MGRRKTAYDYIDALKKLHAAGVLRSPAPNRGDIIVDASDDEEVLLSIEERSRQILGLVNNTKRNAANMLFFVMYDIESNKVRRYIVKYLEKKGCIRVQKSIFLADLLPTEYQEIRHDLTEVQAAYENDDSILIVPISTELLKSMKIIGQHIDVDIITHTKNTLFF